MDSFCAMWLMMLSLVYLLYFFTESYKAQTVKTGFHWGPTYISNYYINNYNCKQYNAIQNA